MLSKLTNSDPICWNSTFLRMPPRPKLPPVPTQAALTVPTASCKVTPGTWNAAQPAALTARAEQNPPGGTRQQPSHQDNNRTLSRQQDPLQKGEFCCMLH